MEAWRNSTETQQPGHAPSSGPEVKNGRSSAKDGVPERLGCRTIQEQVSQILQRVSAGAAYSTIVGLKLEYLGGPIIMGGVHFLPSLACIWVFEVDFLFWCTEISCT